MDLMFRLTFRTRFCLVAERLVRVDRTPSREVGLLNLFATRDDRKYDSLERRHRKWVELPEVIGTKYERPVREMLREFYYQSTEAKIHQLKMGPAFRRIGCLRAMGQGYASIIATLVSRKIVKLRHRLGSRKSHDDGQPVGPEGDNTLLPTDDRTEGM